MRFVAALVWLLSAAVAAAADCPPPPPAPTPAQLQDAQRRDRGLLWSLRRDGRTSWLYGTLHVGRPEWVAAGPQVSAALAASTVLALEIDPTDPGTRGELAAPSPSPPAALPPPLQARLSRQLAAACLADGAFGTMPPALQVVVLTVMQARWVGLDPGYGQEAALARGARARALPIVALESVGLQKKVLVPDSDASSLAQVDETLAQLESGSGRGAIERLARAWEGGDLAALEDYAQWCDCVRNDAERAAMRALNDARNPALAAGIAALHDAGGTVFAAVGALHMTGPQALPLLLAARGFAVERVAFGAPGRRTIGSSNRSSRTPACPPPISPSSFPVSTSCKG